MTRIRTAFHSYVSIYIVCIFFFGKKDVSNSGMSQCASLADIITMPLFANRKQALVYARIEKAKLASKLHGVHPQSMDSIKAQRGQRDIVAAEKCKRAE